MIPEIQEISGRSDSAEENRLAAISRSRKLDEAFNIHTDGSTTANALQEGAGFVITTCGPLDSIVKDSRKRKCKEKRPWSWFPLTIQWVLVSGHYDTPGNNP